MNKILRRKNKKGFTLMEMLIVVGIISILVAIAIPTFSGAQKKAKYAADVANVRAWYAEILVKDMNGETSLPAVDDTYTGKLQMPGAVATVTSVDPYIIKYTLTGGDASDSKYPQVTFPAS